MKITVCQPGHAAFFTPQPSQMQEWFTILSQGLFVPQICDHAYSAWRGNKVVTMAGIVRYREDQAMAWALFSSDIGADMVPVVKLMRRILYAYPLPRVEMRVTDDFPASLRLAKILGMVEDIDLPVTAGFGGRALRVYKRPGDDGRRDVSSG